MESIRTPRTSLALMALMATAAVMIGLLFLAPSLETPDVPIPAPKAQAIEQEMEQAWENLVDAIRREDQVEALRIAEWLDKQHGLKKHATEVIQDWVQAPRLGVLQGGKRCQIGGIADGTTGATCEPIIQRAVSGGGWWRQDWHWWGR